MTTESKHPRTVNTIEELESVGDYVAISSGWPGDIYRSVTIVKTEEGYSVIDNGEETTATTALEAAIIAADYLKVGLG